MKQINLAVGLANNSEVRIDETSKMLADIFMVCLRVCCWRVKALLLVNKNKAERREIKDIILDTRTLNYAVLSAVSCLVSKR